jgi:hypothetical protein
MAEKKPSMAEMLNTIFTARDGSFGITVTQADHALHHFREMYPRCAGALNPQSAELGIMGACLAHALEIPKDEGKEMLEHNTEFQRLVTVLIDTFYMLAAEELYQTITARLS